MPNKQLSEQQIEVKDKNVTVTVTKQPGSLVELKVYVTPEAVNAAYTSAVKAVSKEISLPGFRKGKAPQSLIIQNYEGVIQREWREIILSNGFQNALQLAKLYPYSQDSVKVTEFKNISRDTGANFTIAFEAVPSVPSINLEDLEFKHIERPAVTDKNIHEMLDFLRYYHADWKDATNRPVKEGDYVDLDIENIDVDPPESLCRDNRFEAKKGKMAKWMLKLILGHHVNDQIEGVTENDEIHAEECEDQSCEHPAHKADFKPIRCRITIKAIKEAHLPTVDAAFATKVGAPNVAKLMEELENDLNRRADQDVRQQIRDQVEEALLQRYVFDIPASLIEDEKKHRYAFEISKLKNEGLSKDELNQRKTDLEEKVKSDAEKAYRWFFLAGQISRQFNLPVTAKEVTDELKQQMQLKERNAGILRGVTDQDQMRNMIANHLLTKKVKDFIVEHVLEKGNNA